MSRAIADRFQVPPDFFIGAQKGTQTNDIAWSSQIVIEKSLDTHSKGCIGSSDIRRFFDSVRLLHVVQYLISLGVAPSMLAICLCLQICPVVQLYLLGCTIVVKHRTVGSLTGSSLAGIFGHVIICDMIVHLAPKLSPLGWGNGDAKLTLSIWVDNMYAYAHTVTHALSILDRCEEFLSRRWSLKIKPSSKCILVAKNGDKSCIPDDWTWEESMLILGHSVCSNAGIP